MNDWNPPTPRSLSTRARCPRPSTGGGERTGARERDRWRGAERMPASAHPAATLQRLPREQESTCGPKPVLRDFPPHTPIQALSHLCWALPLPLPDRALPDTAGHTLCGDLLQCGHPEVRMSSLPPLLALRMTTKQKQWHLSAPKCNHL